jgi:hypothetical protein
MIRHVPLEQRGDAVDRMPRTPRTSPRGPVSMAGALMCCPSDPRRHQRSTPKAAATPGSPSTGSPARRPSPTLRTAPARRTPRWRAQPRAETSPSPWPSPSTRGGRRTPGLGVKRVPPEDETGLLIGQDERFGGVSRRGQKVSDPVEDIMPRDGYSPGISGPRQGIYSTALRCW